MPVNKISLVLQIKVWIKIILLFPGNRYSMRDLLSDLNNYAWAEK